MKQNIFAILQTNDSDDEGKKVKKPVEEGRPNKKQLREEDKQKREHFGDQVEKDTHPSHAHKDGPKDKGDYKSGEKRPFERKSGTGRPAFTNDYKKGGHGKGNVGTEKDALNEKEVQAEKGKEEVAEPEPKEEIMTLEDYMKGANYNPEFLKKEEEVKIGKVQINDPTVKVMQPKQKEAEQYNKKNVKHGEEFVHAQTKNVIVDTESKPKFKQSNAKRNDSKLEFNEKNFPALS